MNVRLFGTVIALLLIAAVVNLVVGGGIGQSLACVAAACACWAAIAANKRKGN